MSAWCRFCCKRRTGRQGSPHKRCTGNLDLLSTPAAKGGRARTNSSADHGPLVDTHQDQQSVVRGESTRESEDRKSTRLNSSHLGISYAVFCLKKKKKQ